MSTLQPEYETDLTAALDRLHASAEYRGRCRVTDFGEFVLLSLPGGRDVELGIAQRVLNEGGMSEAIEKELRASGIN